MKKRGVKYNYFTAEAVFNSSNPSLGYREVKDYSTMSDHVIVPQRCGFWTKIACRAAIYACGAVCIGTGPKGLCYVCLDELGRSGCKRCV